ncbi:MAG: hypothetical protein AAF802_27660 [Planctomycetota bacterium]
MNLRHRRNFQSPLSLIVFAVQLVAFSANRVKATDCDASTALDAALVRWSSPGKIEPHLYRTSTSVENTIGKDSRVLSFWIAQDQDRVIHVNAYGSADGKLNGDVQISLYSDGRAFSLQIPSRFDKFDDVETLVEQWTADAFEGCKLVNETEVRDDVIASMKRIHTSGYLIPVIDKNCVSVLRSGSPNPEEISIDRQSVFQYRVGSPSDLSSDLVEANIAAADCRFTRISYRNERETQSIDLSWGDDNEVPVKLSSSRVIVVGEEKHESKTVVLVDRQPYPVNLPNDAFTLAFYGLAPLDVDLAEAPSSGYGMWLGIGGLLLFSCGAIVVWRKYFYDS